MSLKTLRAAATALITASLLFLAFSGRSAAKAPETGQKSPLPAQYKKWLDEEVVYIITRTERDVFQKLQTDKERDLFIEAFWKQRDPTPNSPENEFKTEHYRRLDYANHVFGRDSTRAGWRTDRGRIYIILGEPNDIQKFEGGLDVVPSEIWFYQDKAEFGLPPGFNVVFFKEHGHGEFRLYSPATDGPMALLTGMGGDPTDYLNAYLSLKDKEPNLAAVSLSLVPGEDSDTMGRPSLSSDMLIQKIESTPQRQVQVSYAEKFLKYKDIVEVEYSANYLDSEALVKVFQDASGIPFIHFALEPRRLSVNQYEDRFYSTLKLNGSLALPDGKIVYQYDRTIDLKFDEARMREVGGLPFDIQDLIPAVPGEYKLSVLVKNEVSKEFSTLEQTVRISPVGGGPQLTPPLLGYKLAKLDAAQQKRLRAFQFGENVVYCQPNRVFLTKDTLIVAFQIIGLAEDLRPRAQVRFTFLRDDRPFKEIVRQAADWARLPDVIEEIPLTDFPPSHYGVQLSFLLDGREVAKTGEEFDVTYRDAIARPWAHSRVLPERDNPIFSHILGVELANLGRPDEALVYLEKAYRQKPDDPETVAVLAQIYMTRGEFVKITPLVEPFLGREKPAYEILYLAGLAYLGIGQFASAEAVLGRAMSRYGVNANLLNALGECYREQGRADEALAAWRKSLELNSDQPEIKQKVGALTKKN
jgi:GWxTD domain-containing protein